MKKIVLVLVASLLLLGCTSETPKGNVAAPTEVGYQPTATASSPGEVTTTPEPKKDSYAFGETATTREGLEITVLGVKNVEKEEFTRTYNFSVVSVRVKNAGSEQNPFYAISPAMLDDRNQQYDQQLMFCPEPGEPSGNIYPGITKEFNLCFDRVSPEAKKVKIVLPVGLVERTNLVFVTDSGSIVDGGSING